MITKTKTGKIKSQVQIKKFNLARQDFYPVVFDKFIYKNNFLFN